MNKAKKSALNTAYQQFMKAGFRSEGMSSLQKFVVKDIAGYGTAGDEKIKGVTGLKTLLHNQKKQMKGMALTWKTKPFSRYITEDENTAVFAEDVYLTIKAGKELIKMYLRFSVVLNYINDQWKVIHWHGSKPEQVQSEEDTFGIDILKKKNAELEKLVEKKTADLIKKNRELEIEASLERVRSRTMAMHKTSEIGSLIFNLYTELTKLDAELDRCFIMIVNPDTSNITWWLSGKEGLLDENGFLVQNNNHPSHQLYLKYWKTKKKKWQYLFQGKEKKVWDKFGFTKTELANLPEPVKKDMASVHKIYLSGSSDSFGSLLTGSMVPLSDEHQNIISRFAVVFNQAYTRFLDLQKAEAQARKAEIELGLERVRTRAMAMHTSNELKEVAKEMRTQLHLLGQKELETCAIHLWDESSGQFEAWAALRSPDNTGKIIESESNFKIKGIKILEENFQHYLDGKKDYVLINDVAKARQFFEALKPVDPKAYAFLSPTIKNKKLRDISAYWAISDFIGGSLVMVTMNPPEDNSRALLRRFADVFGLAYRRFSDLQKAEAQAREAEIELALERVRARTMAMQKSEELRETTLVLFQQFKSLGATTAQVSLCLFDAAIKTGEMFVTLKGKKIDRSFTMELDKEIFVMRKVKKAFLDHQENISVTITGKTLQKYNRWRNLFVGKTSYDESDAVRKQSWSVNAAFFSGGMMAMSSETSASEEDKKLLERFTKVFEQSYTRFLDLQKAEAQARESQIQLALERVRARTMAMQDSKELSDTSFLLANQVRELGINAWGCAFHIYGENEEGDYEWFSNEDGYLPFYKTPRKKYFKQYFENRHCDEGIFIKEFKGKACATHYDFLMQIPVVGDALRGLIKSGIALPTSQIDHIVYFEYGYLLFITYKPVQEAHHIFKRFTKEFEQTYIRFLDLQKAEAQAREAQIQLALERVRAKTMAMQKSDELGEAAVLLFKQIKNLGIETYASGFNIWDKESKNLVSWMSNPTGEINPPFEMPIESFERHRKIYAAWKKNETYYEEDIKDDALVKHYKFLRSFPLLDEAFKKSEAVGIATPDRQVHNVAFFKQGFLLFITLEPHPEWKDIFIRFASVFEQTYTRFNDLNQAEAQAKEAQIEAALERIRSMVTAMHESNELLDIVVKMRTEFVALGHDAHYFWHMKWTREKYLKAMTSGDGSRIGMVMELPRKIHAQIKQIADWEKSKEPAVVFVMNVNETLDYVHKMATWGDFERVDPNMPSEEDIHQIGGLTFIMARTQHGEIGYSLPGMVPHPPQDAVNTLIRFAAVFDLAYRRFEDLKTAEKQNRETQVELALEKVRSRSMGMQKSEELREVIRIVYEQLIQLNIHVEHAGFLIDYKKGDNLHIWLADEHLAPSEVIFPWFDCPPNNAIREAKEKGDEFFFYHLNFKEKNKFYRDLFNLIPGIPEETVDYYFKCPGLAGSGVLLESIGLYIENFSGTVYTEEENAVLMRFGKVFQQTYTRFLDLQKAEAQAREAKIEAALEKVRSRTMAMQKSIELGDVATVLFKELNQLVANLWTCGFVLCEKGRQEDEWWLSTESGFIPAFYLPNEGDATHYNIYQGWLNGESYHTEQIEGEALRQHYDWLMSIPIAKRVFDELEAAGFEKPEWQKLHCAYFSKGYLCIITREPCSEEEIFKRFAQVFDLTYTRFLDLQKAEAQAREAQIEAALERVRARTMAMQKSSELNATADLLFDQLRHLGAELQGVAFAICDKDSDIVQKWTSIGVFSFPYTIEPAEQNMYEAWKNKVPLYEEVFEGERIKKYYETLMEVPAFKQGLQQLLDAGVPMPIWQKNHAVSFQQGYLLIITTKPFAETQIFIRFGKVFEQTYTRFLDLQKAEAQAREAQIETGLERVRSKTMAMHKSEEVNGIAVSLNEELLKLGFEGGSTIIVMNKQSGDMEQWTGFSADKNLQSCLIPYFKHPFHDAQLDTWKKGEKFLEYTLSGKEKKLFDDHYFATGYANFPESDKQWMRAIKSVTFSHAFMKYGAIHWGPHHLSEDQQGVLHRFAKVFEQSYTRFLDLKKAEAQAREAQIEAALERVRSRSMAMHKSDELLEVINVVSNQLQQLEIRFGFVCFGVIHPQGNLDFWMAAPGLGKPEKIHMPFVNNPITNSLLDAHKKGTRVLTDFFPKAVMLEWSKVFFENNPDSQIMAQSKEYIQESPGLVRTSVILKEIDVFAGKFADKPFTDEQNEIIIRFANVFEQSYIRFLDLQKAEMQAREAKIEVSLEKVRTVALILKKSDEMLDVVQALYEALYELGFSNIRNSIIDVHNPQKETFLDYDYSPQLGRSITEMSYYDSPFIENQVRKTESDNGAFFELILEGQELQELIDMRLKNGEAEDPRLRQTKQLTYNLYSFGNGAIGISNFGLLSDDQKGILKRFRNVFAFAYKRYSDMVQAEAQAREAQIEAALEKVRSRTLAMQKSDELAETAAVLFQQLIILGIAPNRLFIIIMKADSAELEAWVTDEDGSKVSLGFTANYQNNPSIKKMYQGWLQQKKSLVIDMQGEELQQYFHYLHDELKVPFKGGLEQKRRIQHLAYFSHGLIGMASPDEQPAETMLLLERFAAVFNLTFTRFNDLKIAEAHAIQAEQDLIAIKEAKQKAEEALTELQSTQKQLIQSEKMASLGELTAGIAHEIQNPLNFVNNFSEVSKELLDEMRDAMEKGDTEDAKEIMNDVIQNLEKINYHGKRADGIVKGMLQHSRSSTGQKELTDINALCDEYLRLSYHGLRAKDKSFNAKFETDFDNSIGKISVVPQEIGRVVLNLINNAFYAVSERKKLNEQGYEPTVIVSTIKETDAIKIKVKDNGTGIPQKVLDKIFQPFFTTKPTGSGTGLGLSLSYDIVKAHGGEIKVDTKEGEGTTFIVQLTKK